MPTVHYTPAANNGGKAKCSTCCPLTFSFGLLVCGTLLLALGTWLYVTKPDDLLILGTMVTDGITYGALICGSAIILASFLAIAGVCCMKRGFMFLSMLLFTLLTITAFSGGAYLVITGSNSTDRLTNYLERSLTNEYGYVELTSVGWDNVQTVRNCCAVATPLDYQSTRWTDQLDDPVRLKVGGVPESCCVSDRNGRDEQCLTKPVHNNDYIHETGCRSALQTQFSKWFRYAYLTAFGLGAAMAFNIALIFCFTRNHPSEGQFV